MLLDRYYCLPAASYYQDDCPDADEGGTRAALTIATLLVSIIAWWLAAKCPTASWFHR